jgi:phage terminase large subunit
MFQKTTAINKLLTMKRRKKVVQGGTWAGKTFGILPILINKAVNQSNKRITIIAESIPALKEGVIDDFKSIMLACGYWEDDRYNITDRQYSFTNSSRIEFKSFDSIGKALASGKRTDLFINEANYIDFEIADALITRTTEDIWIDYNPTSSFWVHDEIIPQKDAEFVLLKYTDNEALPQTIYDELQLKNEKAKTSNYWANWCRVYIDGEIGMLEGVIFDNWKSIDIMPHDARLIGAGLDFGYTNDPTALIAAYKYNDVIIFDEIIYQKGLLNSEIRNYCKDLKTLIYADSAEPKSIAELKRYGLRIQGARKGKDSINFGISLLQEKPFYVTSRSTNLIKELRSYTWKRDRAGESLNKPIDAYNHGIDAMMYFAIMSMTNKKKFIRIIV